MISSDLKAGCPVECYACGNPDVMRLTVQLGMFPVDVGLWCNVCGSLRQRDGEKWPWHVPRDKFISNMKELGRPNFKEGN